MKKKNITPRNENGQRHGYWKVYWTNGSITYKCFFNNGKYVGYEELYGYDNNELNYKTYFI